MIETQFYILLWVLGLILVLLLAIVREVFVDADIKALKRGVKIKTLQAQDQSLTMKLQGMFQEIEGKPIDKEGKSSEQPNAIGYEVERD